MDKVSGARARTSSRSRAAGQEMQQDIPHQQNRRLMVALITVIIVLFLAALSLIMLR